MHTGENCTEPSTLLLGNPNVLIFTNTANCHVKSLNFHGKSHNFTGKTPNFSGFYTNFHGMYYNSKVFSKMSTYTSIVIPIYQQTSMHIFSIILQKNIHSDKTDTHPNI